MIHIYIDVDEFFRNMIDRYGCVPIIGVPSEQGEDHFDSLKDILSTQNIVRVEELSIIKQLKEKNKSLVEENKSNVPRIAYWESNGVNGECKCSLCGADVRYQNVNGNLTYEPFCAHCGSKMAKNKDEAEYLEMMRRVHLTTYSEDIEPIQYTMRFANHGKFSYVPFTL